MILSAIATELKQHAKGDFKRRHYEAALQVPEAHKSAYASGPILPTCKRLENDRIPATLIIGLMSY